MFQRAKAPESVEGLYLRATKARYLWLTMPNQSWLYANYISNLIKSQKRVPQLFYAFFEDGILYLYYPKNNSGSVVLAQVTS